MKKVLLGVACLGFAGWAGYKALEPPAPPPVVDAAALVTVRSDPNGQCGKRLSVKVSNASARTVKRVRFFVHMYEPGRSTDFASYEGHLWDRVLGPGEARTMCFEFPPVRQGDLPDEAVAVPEKRAVEFYEPGEYIPR